MDAQGRLPFERKPEPTSLPAFLVALLLRPGPSQRHRVEKAQLRVFGSAGEHCLQFRAGGGPIAEFDKRRHQMRPDFHPRVVFREEGAVDLDLLFRAGTGAENCRLPESCVQVAGPNPEHLIERVVGGVRKTESEEGATDPELRGYKSWLELRGLAIKSQGQGRDAPFQPGSSPPHDRVQELSAREESRSERFRGSRLLTEKGF